METAVIRFWWGVLSFLDDLLIVLAYDATAASVTAHWAFGIVTNERRRFLLYLLNDGEVRNVDELSLQITASQLDVHPEEVPEARRKQVVRSLIHTDLPKLAERGLVEFDRRSGDVVPREVPDALDRLITVARTIDDVPVESDSEPAVE